MKKTQMEFRSRRNVLRTGLAVLATGGLASAAMADERAGHQRFAQTEKLAQTIVQYQETPKDGAKCSTCVNFEAPNACKIVAGNINPEGWCVAYAPKST